MGSNTNPFSGAVPINMIIDRDKIIKSTSYRSGVTFPIMYRTPQQDPSLHREEGCTPLRRYPNGKLDITYVAQNVVDMIHKVENGGELTHFEQSLLTLVLPHKFQFVDPKIAESMARITEDERALVAVYIMRHINEELNYNAGRGSNVPFRHTTKS